MPNQPHQLPSERKFGLFFTAVFVIFAGYLAYHNNTTAAISLLVAAVIIALAAIFSPHLLRPLNKAWYALGLLLGMIVSPLVLGVIFYLLITPFGLIIRLFGHDPLRLKKKQLATHWVIRTPPGPDPSSFKNQF